MIRKCFRRFACKPDKSKTRRVASTPHKFVFNLTFFCKLPIEVAKFTFDPGFYDFNLFHTSLNPENFLLHCSTHAKLLAFPFSGHQSPLRVERLRSDRVQWLLSVPYVLPPS